MTRDQRAKKADEQAKRHQSREELSWNRIARERREYVNDMQTIKLDDLAEPTAAVASLLLINIGMTSLLLDALKLINDNDRDRETIRDNAYHELLKAIARNTAGAAWMSESSP